MSEPSLTIRYESPQREAVVREARLEFEFDDNEIGIANVITVDLIAAGGGARACCLEVQPQGGGLLGPLTRRYGTLQFGRVIVGQEKIMPIRITNVGSELCEIRSWVFDPPQTPRREFRIIGDHEGLGSSPARSIVSTWLSRRRRWRRPKVARICRLVFQRAAP